MKITSKEDMSRWAYFQCKKGNNTEEMRSLIIIDAHICWYCSDIEDRKDMWTKIKDPYWARAYCEDIENRSELRKIVKESIKRISGR